MFLVGGVFGSCDGALRAGGACLTNKQQQPTTKKQQTQTKKALVEEGKVRFVGISEASAADIRAAHAACPLSAVQLEWSLWSRDVEVRGVGCFCCVCGSVERG